MSRITMCQNMYEEPLWPKLMGQSCECQGATLVAEEARAQGCYLLLSWVASSKHREWCTLPCLLGPFFVFISHSN
jgi:hypothetical protein